MSPPPMQTRRQQQDAKSLDEVRTLDDYSSSGEEYTLDEAVERCGPYGRFQWFVLFYTGLSWMADAMEVMILSYVGPAAKCQWGLTSYQETQLNSMVFAGMCIGAPFWGTLSDALGRRTALFMATLFTAIFGFASAASPNYGALLAFRTLVGFGIPGACVAFGMLLEFVPTASRGVFLVAIEGFWTLGTVIQATLAFLMLNRFGWRVLLAVSGAPLVILLLLTPLVPESPRFLLVKGKVEAAEGVLKRVLAVSKATLPPGRLKSILDDDKKHLPPHGLTKSRLLLWKVKHNLKELRRSCSSLAGPQLRWITVNLLFLWVVSAFVYYGLVILVAQIDFMEGGSKECSDGKIHVPNADMVAILITSAAEVPGLIMSIVLVKFLTRQQAFALPMAGISVVLIPLMAGVKGGGAVACLFLSRLLIFGSFNLIWCMTPEYYPTSVRSFALGINNSFSRVGGFFASYAAVNAPESTGWAHTPEAIFAGLAFITAIAAFLLPGDPGKERLADVLDDVDRIAAQPSVIGSMASMISGNGSHIRRDTMSRGLEGETDRAGSSARRRLAAGDGQHSSTVV